MSLDFSPFSLSFFLSCFLGGITIAKSDEANKGSEYGYVARIHECSKRRIARSLDSP